MWRLELVYRLLRARSVPQAHLYRQAAVAPLLIARFVLPENILMQTFLFARIAPTDSTRIPTAHRANLAARVRL